MNRELHIVCWHGEIWLSRTAYDEWPEFQDEVPDNVGSEGPMSPGEAVNYLNANYPELRPAANLVNAFLGSGADSLLLGKRSSGGRFEAL